MGQKASKEVAKKAAATDPLTGFARGALRTPQEEAQAKFLRGGQDPSKKPSEMAPELIKFITDIGPLKYKDESMMKRKTRMTDSSRKTQNMRLAENIEGYETRRTTSFSTKKEIVDKNDFGLDVIQLFGLLSNRSDTTKFPKEHLAMVEHAKKAIQLPVLMEDREDKSYLGMLPEDSKQTGPNLVPLPISRVKLVLEDLWESDAAAAAATPVPHSTLK